MTITAVIPSLQQALPTAFSQPAIWRVTPMAGDAHGVTVRLSNGHQLQIDEASAQVRIINTDAQPPTVTTLPDDLSGRSGSGADLAGPLRFVLNDGTKITLQLGPAANGAQPRIEGLVATQGEQSLIVDGIGSRRGGEMRCLPGLNGQALDRLLGNGMPAIRENAQGSGWIRDGAGCAPANGAPSGSATPGSSCDSGPSLPDLRRQLQSLYCGGCGPTTPPVHGKHGYGKHGCEIGLGKHSVGDYGKHSVGGYGKHSVGAYGKHGVIDCGKHGVGGYGKHGVGSVSPSSGCDPLPVCQGKHTVGTDYGKHGSVGKHGGHGKHGVGC
ncbi:MAG: DUF1521 domain-containing protein [Betaproteobacteria bacterium]|nr:DUF1521 domain-containing protein [Betaproteobacteria bacterium]